MTEAQTERELDRLAGLARAAEPPALAPFETRRLVREAVLAAERTRRTNGRMTWAALAVAAVLALAYALVGDESATRLAVAADDNPLRVTLSSGDVLLAMPDSELIVTEDRPALRSVELTRGSALFSVAKLGAAQHFEVQAGAVRVSVLGTVFSVEHGPRGVFVRAYEGRVSVDGSELVAPASWSARRLPVSVASTAMAAEAARFVAERSAAHTVSPLAPTAEPTRAPDVSPRTPDVTPEPSAAPVAAAGPTRLDTWPDKDRARALLRAGRAQEALALSAPFAHLDEAAASVSADALRRLGRGCEAAAHYGWLAERPVGGDARARLGHANLVLSAAQLKFHACADAAGARALLVQHEACAHGALLRERATALLVDILVQERKHAEAAAWARTYLDRETESATSVRMRRIAARAP